MEMSRVKKDHPDGFSKNLDSAHQIDGVKNLCCSSCHILCNNIRSKKET